MVAIPDILDALIVGGGPFGTAAAFRAKELGLSALVIDHDDLMKRIRDYAKDKLILPDYGGGDQMQFPAGGVLIGSLRFGPIDKDALCVAWKALYELHGVPARTGVELLGLDRDGEHWRATVWNHRAKSEEVLRARHVVLALGRGEPRRLDIAGDLSGMAFRLTDASQYTGSPVCVIGGGTSAAEAVIALSHAKAAASDASAVYWSYRGEKMPAVSKALAEVFFDAFIGNGNVRYLPNSEPVAVSMNGDIPHLCVRTARRHTPMNPAETSHLEFPTVHCIACIGEDIPEQLLARIGVPPVVGGPANKRRLVVSPLLETRQSNVYLAGDILSPGYLEATDFDGDPGAFAEIKRRGNIKAALRDGVWVAEVIAQKLAGRRDIHVELPTEAVPEGCSLVSILPGGVEANEFRLSRGGITTIGRHSSDIRFTDDTALGEPHAAVVHSTEGYRIRREGASNLYLQPATNRLVPLSPGAMFKAGAQWLVIGDEASPMALVHFDAAGQRKGRYELEDGATVVGRDAPDLKLAAEDGLLSRRHFALIRSAGNLHLKDLGSANGTQLKVDGSVGLAHGDLLIIGHQTLRFTDDRLAARPKTDVTFHSVPAVVRPDPAGGGRMAQAGGPRAVPEAAPGTPSIHFQAANHTVPCRKGQTIREAAEAAGIRLQADCHQGVCGMDPVRIDQGLEYMNEIGGTERDTLETLCSLAPGSFRLACMARPAGPISVDVIKQ